MNSNCIITDIQHLDRVATRIVDQNLRAAGITSNQYILLREIGRSPGIAAVDLTKVLDIEKSTLSRNLQRLIGDGLIAVDAPVGREGRAINLTTEGERTLRQAHKRWLAGAAEVAELISATAAAAIANASQKIAGALEV